jgi:uncharacterized membrane protein
MPMPTYTNATTIDAPVERVWQVLTDVEHWPELTASMTSVRGLDGPRPVLGARFEVRQPRLRPAVWTVTRLVEGAAFDWESRAPGVRTLGTHLLEPTGSSTRLTLAIEQSGALAWPLAFLAARTIRRYLAMEAAGLATASTHPTP